MQTNQSAVNSEMDQPQIPAVTDDDQSDDATQEGEEEVPLTSAAC